MVSSTTMQTKNTAAAEIPTVDLSSGNRENLSKLMVEVCENFGFFKLINHGVPTEPISRLEEEAAAFFGKPVDEKQAARPAAPFGYGFKNIGRNGDMGDVEYLLLHSNPTLVPQILATISCDPSKFSCAVNDYVEACRNLTCEILDLLGEGLWLSEKSIFSRLIRDVQNDSILRINHYPPLSKAICDWPDPPPNPLHQAQNGNNRIGFGEHFDPQILTILRSNDVDGLQISLHDEGVWTPVSSDPSAFFVLVGDAFQALTNGRFKSIKHRVTTNTDTKARMSIIYSAAPPMSASMCPPSEMVTAPERQLYRPFTWAEFKTVFYSLRLAESRLDLFKIKP